MGQITPGQTSEATATPTPQELGAGLTHIRLSEDRMTVVLVSPSIPGGVEALPEALRTDLKELGISDEQQVEQAIHRAQSATETNTSLVGLVLIEGAPPEPPIDGHMTWAGDFFKRGFHVDPETGQVDYRKPAAESNVAKGDCLGELMPPVEGKDGADVFGNGIAVDKAVPLNVKPGQHVIEAEGRFYAEDSGQVRFADDVLAVDNIYMIEGSVGLATGHISHPGALVVNENIDSGSEIDAAGSVEVNGYIEDADITAGGDLIVNGGIIGDGDRKILVKGDLHARFLKNADIEVSGHIFVVNGIEQCTIRSRGSVLVSSGRIVGGDIQALGGIEAVEIGSEAGVATSVTTGFDYTMAARLEEGRFESEDLSEKLTKIQLTLEPLRARTASMTPQAREMMTTLLHQTQEIKERLQTIEDETEALTNEFEKKAGDAVIIQKRVHSGVSVTVGRVTKQIDDEVAGPLRVMIKDGDLRVLQRSAR